MLREVFYCLKISEMKVSSMLFLFKQHLELLFLHSLKTEVLLFCFSISPAEFFRKPQCSDPFYFSENYISRTANPTFLFFR